MEVVIQMHPDGTAPHVAGPLREAAAAYASAHGAPEGYRGIAAAVRETSSILLDVTGEDRKAVFLETLKAVCELAGARRWTEAQWETYRRDLLDKLRYARTAIEIKLAERQTGVEKRLEYDEADRITVVREANTFRKQLLVTGW
jgi:hypothetical protein